MRPHIYTPAHDFPRSLFPLMTQPAADRGTLYEMRLLLARTLAWLRGRP